MSEYKFGRPSYLVFCLLAVVLFGSYVLLTGFQEELRNHGPVSDTRSLTSRAFFLANHTGPPARRQVVTHAN